MLESRWIAVVAAFAAGVVPAPAQIDIGADAPELRIDARYNFPDTVANLAGLRGSAVLLEYWATW
ncbi:MAG TPA: hypothetical protein VK348_09640 [Planctomycetota bacterium]|nr:hypothetical protein [Planctomycetota bacterium]